jgi:hypothetical protein
VERRRNDPKPATEGLVILDHTIPPPGEAITLKNGAIRTLLCSDSNQLAQELDPNYTYKD